MFHSKEVGGWHRLDRCEAVPRRYRTAHMDHSGHTRLNSMPWDGRRPQKKLDKTPDLCIIGNMGNPLNDASQPVRFARLTGVIFCSHMRTA